MIYYITWGDENTASTRLRVANIIPYLKDAYVGVPEQYEKGDTLIIQKTPAIDELKKAQKQGAKVVYDLDDLYTGKGFKEMIAKADIVTVATDEMSKQIKDSIVIPNSLDWDGTKKETYEHNGIVGWTGYGNNSSYLNKLVLPKGLQLRLITDNHWDHYDKLVQSRPWSIAMVDKYLAECDLGVYYMPLGQFEKVKSMHKLLKNWAIGLPTYTSAVPDYVKAMEEAGVGKKFIIKTGREIKDVPFDEALREYALQYEAHNIAELWKKVIN